MDEHVRNKTIERYSTRFAKHGHSPESLGWGKNGKQEIRFRLLAAHALANPDWSVLDVGCGFADLYEFLVAHGWHGKYTGIDLVPALLGVARERHPTLDLRQLDITEATLDVHDIVIASGVANARLERGDNATHTEAILRAMVAHARYVTAMDFLSTRVDFQRPEGWHTDPAWALALAMSLSGRVALRHDYLPYEFAVIVHVNDRVTSTNAFAEDC